MVIDNKQKGFTLIELLITIVIIGVVFIVGAGSGMTDWKSKKSGKNLRNELVNELIILKGQAESRDTTTRVTLVNSSGTYTMTTYQSSSPTTTCSSLGSWTTISTKTIDVDPKYEVTGSAMSNTCFYRGGGSSGGSLSVTPVDTGSSLASYTIDITISTGFLDVY